MRTLESVENVREGMDTKIPSNMASVEIKQALYHMGGITAEISSDYLLENILLRISVLGNKYVVQ